MYQHHRLQDIPPMAESSSWKIRQRQLMAALLLTLGLAAVVFSVLPSDRQHEFVMQSTAMCARKHPQQQSPLSPPRPPQFADGRYFIALNLHQNMEVLPHLMQELLRSIEYIGGENAFVSIYESGSTDETKTMLYLLDNMLEVRGVQHAITAGNYTRSEGQHRIDYLVQVRNMAMKPLYEGEFDADFVWFLNDVFFCAEDAARLSHLTSTPQVAMSCGLDYVDTSPPIFYDTWVARDMAGNTLQHLEPHFTRPQDIQKMAREEPVPVYCCWNGMTVLKAAPFVRGGLRFRLPFADQCQGSECSTLCDDLWAMDIDNVTLAYTKDVAEVLAAASSSPSRSGRVVKDEDNDQQSGMELELVAPDTFLCAPLLGSGDEPDVGSFRIGVKHRNVGFRALSLFLSPSELQGDACADTFGWNGTYWWHVTDWVGGAVFNLDELQVYGPVDVIVDSDGVLPAWPAFPSFYAILVSLADGANNSNSSNSSTSSNSSNSSNITDAGGADAAIDGPIWVDAVTWFDNVREILDYVLVWRNDTKQICRRSEPPPASSSGPPSASHAPSVGSSTTPLPSNVTSIPAPTNNGTIIATTTTMSPPSAAPATTTRVSTATSSAPTASATAPAPAPTPAPTVPPEDGDSGAGMSLSIGTAPLVQIVILALLLLLGFS